VILITHKLREVMAVTDRVSVMRGVDLSLHAGEILGIAGVAGNGQTELLEALSGMRAPSAGTIRLRGAPLAPCDAAAMRRLGLAHVPEDRLRHGLVTAFEAQETAILGHERDARWRRWLGLISRRAVGSHAAALMAANDVRPPLPQLRSSLFSGGNQQKLIMARELEREPDILLVGQPTRGVDIGGIEAIHARLRAWRDAGKAVLLVSVELDEILALADRILVMFDGRLVGELPAGADERQLGLLMAGAAA
jgi:simple sugar transport system ATP-binding protein